jgi:hypothetical protein
MIDFFQTMDRYPNVSARYVPVTARPNCQEYGVDVKIFSALGRFLRIRGGFANERRVISHGGVNTT